MNILFDACKIGKLEIVKNLLNDRRLNINEKDKNGITAFHWACLRACLKGDLSIVEF